MNLAWSILHALLLGVTVLLFAAPLTVASAAVWGAMGAVAGALAADLLGRWRVRPLASALAALGVALVISLFAGWVAGAAFVGRMVGPPTALAIVEGMRWFAGFGLAAWLLRLGVQAWRPLLVVEAVAVGAALASPLAAHRRGMVARPLELSDWFWSRGLDPVWGFVAAGVCASAVVAGLWLRPGRARAGLVALVGVVLVAMLIAPWVHRDIELPSPEPPKQGAAAGQGRGSGEPEKSPSDIEEQARRRDDPKLNRPVAVVVLHRDFEPFGGVYYLRSEVFSQFNGVRLAPSFGEDADVSLRYPGAAPVESGAPPPDEAPRALVATDVALLAPLQRPLGLVDPVRWEARANPSPARFARMYRVVSQVLEGSDEAFLDRRPGSRAWSEETWSHYTAMPDDPRYLELSTRLVQELPAEYQDDPWAAALTFRRYLEENSTYSFANKYQDEKDPTAAYIFSEDLRGYCVHNAHAVALLLRSRGIPSRVSGGFAVMAERRGAGSAVLVRSNDAHAWAEVYLEGVGWVPVEVVPENSEVEPASFEEDDVQRLLGEMARAEGRTQPTRPEAWDLRPLLRRGFWGALGLLLAGALVVRTVRAVGYRFARHRASAWAYRSVIDGLASAGFRREVGETRERFATRMAPQVPSLGPLTDAMMVDRLGRGKAGPATPRLIRLTRDAGGELWRSVPWWRRTLAALDPISWARSR